MPASVHSKRPRKCIFCDDGGKRGNPVSAEHIWPEWMHEYLPKIPSAVNISARHRIRLGTFVAEKKVREGHVFTRRFRLVCKKCNTGWMSNLETNVKPILIPLLQGQKITLLKKSRKILSEWLCLKTLVTECIDRSNSVVTDFERDEFRENRKFPRSLRIWIGTHDSQDWYTGYWHQTLTGNYGRLPTPSTDVTSELQNIQITALGIGHLFSLSYISTIPEIKMNPRGNIRRLWPIHQNAFVWPLPNLSDADCDEFALSLRELLTAPFSQWVRHRD